MKLNNKTQIKNTKSFFKLCMVLCLLTFTFCANSDALRRTDKKSKTSKLALKSNSKSKALPDEFDSILTIQNNSNTKKYDVKLTKDFLSKPLSGFKFEMQDAGKKIDSPAVTLAPTGGYFVKFQLFTQRIDCQESGWFTKNSMTYFLNDGKNSYTLNFTFPKKWFTLWIADSVKNDDLKDLCNKLASNYDNFKSEYNKKLNEITNLLSTAKNLEADKARNLKSKADFEQAAKAKADVKKVLTDQLTLLNNNKKQFIDAIKKIEESKTSKQKEYDNILLDIANQGQVISNINGIIEEKSKSSASIKLITDKEVNEKYDEIKAALVDYSKIYLPKDPFVVSTLSPLIADVKVNKDRIIPSLRMN